MEDIPKITSHNKTIIIKIRNKNLKYDNLTVNENTITKEIQKIPYEGLGCGDCNKKCKIVETLSIDGILAHYLIQELRISPTYRKTFIKKVNEIAGTTECIINFRLIPAKKEIIDYDW